MWYGNGGQAYICIVSNGGKTEAGNGGKRGKKQTFSLGWKAARWRLRTGTKGAYRLWTFKTILKRQFKYVKIQKLLLVWIVRIIIFENRKCIWTSYAILNTFHIESFSKFKTIQKLCICKCFKSLNVWKNGITLFNFLLIHNTFQFLFKKSIFISLYFY